MKPKALAHSRGFYLNLQTMKKKMGRPPINPELLKIAVKTKATVKDIETLGGKTKLYTILAEVIRKKAILARRNKKSFPTMAPVTEQNEGPE